MVEQGRAASHISSQQAWAGRRNGENQVRQRIIKTRYGDHRQAGCSPGDVPKRDRDDGKSYEDIRKAQEENMLAEDVQEQGQQRHEEMNGYDECNRQLGSTCEVTKS